MFRIILILVAGFLFSCNQDPKAKAEMPAPENKTIVTENFDWLKGNWKRLNEDTGKETFEHWVKVGPGEYSGHGFTLQNRDTLFQERMNLMKSMGNWIFIVKIPNEKDSTTFKLIEIKDNRFVCVNDSNDFPNKIQYWAEGEKLHALISNAKMEIPYTFEKIK